MTINGLAVTVMVGLAVCGKLAEAKTLSIVGFNIRIKHFYGRLGYVIFLRSCQTKNTF